MVAQIKTKQNIHQKLLLRVFKRKNYSLDIVDLLMQTSLVMIELYESFLQKLTCAINARPALKFVLLGLLHWVFEYIEVSRIFTEPFRY